jgi:hypothetical protein
MNQYGGYGIQRDTSPPRRRLKGRRGKFVIAAVVVVALFVAGFWLALSGRSDSSSSQTLEAPGQLIQPSQPSQPSQPGTDSGFRLAE